MNKKILSVWIVTLVVAFIFGYGWSHNWIPQHKTPEVSANLYILIETMNGKAEYKTGNAITNIGERYVRNILGFNNVTSHNATQWISLSNDDATGDVTAWTKLANEITNATNAGFGRKVADSDHLGSVVAWYRTSDFTYNVTVKFTAGADGIQVRAAGLQWNVGQATDNNLFAAAAFTQTTFNTNDNCTIRWIIQWNAN